MNSKPYIPARAADEPAGSTATVEQSSGAKKATTRKPKKRREWPYRLSVVVMILAGIAVTLFPVVGTWYNNYKAIQYANSVVNTQSNGDGDNAHWLAKARKYNDSLGEGEVSDPWTGKDFRQDPKYKTYMAQLSKDQSMARLRIPSLGVTLPIGHGTQEDVLQHGGGHMFGTSLPVGGAGTHAGLAAHRGLPNITGFDNLPDLKQGQDFFVDVYGETLAYRVTAINIVGPTDVRLLNRVKGKDQVTLITCTPYGINSHRLLVTGTRIPLDQANGVTWSQEFDLQIQPWMRVRFGITIAALLIMAYLTWSWIRQDIRNRKRRAAALANQYTPKRLGEVQ